MKNFSCIDSNTCSEHSARVISVLSDVSTMSEEARLLEGALVKESPLTCLPRQGLQLDNAPFFTQHRQEVRNLHSELRQKCQQQFSIQMSHWHIDMLQISWNLTCVNTGLNFVILNNEPGGATNKKSNTRSAHVSFHTIFEAVLRCRQTPSNSVFLRKVFDEWNSTLGHLAETHSFHLHFFKAWSLNPWALKFTATSSSPVSSRAPYAGVVAWSKSCHAMQ